MPIGNPPVGSASGPNVAPRLVTGAGAPPSSVAPPVVTIAADDWATQQRGLPAGQATQSLYANPNRRQFTVLNIGAVTVYIGPDPDVTAANGFPLAAGAAKDVAARGELYIWVPAGGGDGAVAIEEELDHA